MNDVFIHTEYVLERRDDKASRSYQIEYFQIVLVFWGYLLYTRKSFVGLESVDHVIGICWRNCTQIHFIVNDSSFVEAHLQDNYDAKFCSSSSFMVHRDIRICWLWPIYFIFIGGYPYYLIILLGVIIFILIFLHIKEKFTRQDIWSINSI